MIISKPPRLWASWPVSLGRVSRLMVDPPIPLCESRSIATYGTKPRQHPLSAWQTSFGLVYSDPPTLAKLPNALFHIEITHWVLFGSSRVLNDFDWVPPNLIKTRIGAPNRCSPRLPYQISSRIDSGVKFSRYSEFQLLFLSFLTQVSVVKSYLFQP
jgi:hypothetical protein